jgi:Fe-S cluster assembly protein SufD
MTAVADRVHTVLPAWLVALRQQGGQRFTELGLPTSRDEEWRFTPITPISSATFAPAPEATVSLDALAPFLFGHVEWPRLVFVNGRHSAELSSVAVESGVRVESLAQGLVANPALEKHLGRHVALDATPFVAWNTGQISDGAFVHVSARTDLPHPIHLLFITAPGAAGSAVYPRNIVVVEREARASLIESYVTLADAERYLTNVVTEVVVAENAWVEHTRIQRESEQAFHIGLTHVAQERDSHYRNFSFAMGGAIARHDLRSHLNAANVESLLYGLYFGHGEQLVDNHTAIFHDHPSCRSWEVYKGILDGRSHGVFNGKIFVKPEAQKTDAKQTNRALLLSETAKIDTKPQLEIFADDVKCTHGATVGALNESMLFYLQSRCIPLPAARRFLTYAFAAEVVAEIALEPVRAELDRLVQERVGVGMTEAEAGVRA